MMASEADPHLKKVLNVLHKVFSVFDVQKMYPRERRLGEFPSNKRAYKTYFSIAWPCALESLLVSLIGSVDTIMVGRLGTGAIAAVGITNQPKFVLLAMCFALNVGVTAVVARRKGEDDRDGANRAFRSAVLIALAISVVMSVIGIAFAEPIMRFAGAEEEYLLDSVMYFQIVTAGLAFSAVTMVINSAHRGCGNTRITMYTNIASNLVNIFFNYMLINGIWFFPRLGVKGAAIATFIGITVALVIAVVSLLDRERYLTFFLKVGWRIRRTVVQPVMKVSSSAFVEQIFLRIGFMAYTTVVARLGVVSYATHHICMNIINLSFAFGDGFGVAASSLVGQNLGAKRHDLSIMYGKVGQRIAFSISTVLFVFFVMGRDVLIELFNDDPDVVALGATIMVIIAFSTHFQTSQVVLNGCLRGAGDSKFVAVTSLVSVAIIRPVLTWVLCYPMKLGLMGAWISLTVDQSFRFVSALARFNGEKWTRIKL